MTAIVNDRSAALAREKRRKWRTTRLAWMLLLPSFIFLAMFTFYPIGYSIWNSLYKDNNATIRTGPVYVGLKNYVSLFTKDQIFKQAFINAELLETFGDMVPFKEGCLSLPNIYEEVMRPDKIRIKYLDENFLEHEEVFEGVRSRIIQHEYEHLQGHVYVDNIAPLRKTLLQSKLKGIMEGRCDVDYRMVFPNRKKRR